MITNQHIAIVGGTAGIGLAVAQMAADAGTEVRQTLVVDGGASLT